MIVNQLSAQKPFTTADGSTIRSILDRTNAPVIHQSLAEASLAPGGATERHYHRESEEIYFILEGTGLMEINGEQRTVGPGDAILIPPGNGIKFAVRISTGSVFSAVAPLRIPMRTRFSVRNQVNLAYARRRIFGTIPLSHHFL